ncbi:PREDICTED: uncharacterized protein LOC106297974 [Brassica oleracea var. oleracea]|uniref:uncharacterized protein LOC106297974 n=1 Tax=Brassica oleracea var. oleracea TaxID=109376 RepID=UPI0006A6D115|nr:PREDICTED: uncharacterized protein LOC106297974 [Brassica oleracea var. oleracea]
MDLGSLIDIVGSLGPQVSGIPIDSSVSEAVSLGAWRESRSRNPILRRLRQSLPTQIPDINSPEDDYYMWRNSPDDPPSVFSTSKLWTSLNPPPPLVSWQNANKGQVKIMGSPGSSRMSSLWSCGGGGKPSVL